MLTETTIKCFLSLGQTLNFTKTAQNLFMAQQSVSQHIARMEEDLGFPLFVRSKHFVALTKEGEKYYAFFSKMSEQYAQLHNDCLANIAKIAQSIKVGYQNWTDLGPAANYAMNDMWCQYPNVTIEIIRRSPGTLVHKLLQGELQMIVLYKRYLPKSNSIQMVELRELELMILVASDHEIAKKDAVCSDFADLPLIIDNFEFETESETKRRVRQEISRMPFKPSQTIIMPDREASYTACEMGEGFVLSTDINRITRSGSLNMYPIGRKDALVCAWKTDCNNELVKKYASCLENAFRNEEY